MDPKISIRIARAPALLAFSSAVGWVSGVRFDGEPPRVSVCISEAVRPRDEVLPQGNADVPSRTTAGGFSFLLDLHSHFPRSEFQFENLAFSSRGFGLRFRLLRRAISGTARIPLTCVTVVAFRFIGSLHRERLRSFYSGSFCLAIFSR